MTKTLAIEPIRILAPTAGHVIIAEFTGGTTSSPFNLGGWKFLEILWYQEGVDGVGFDAVSDTGTLQSLGTLGGFAGEMGNQNQTVTDLAFTVTQDLSTTITSEDGAMKIGSADLCQLEMALSHTGPVRLRPSR